MFKTTHLRYSLAIAMTLITSGVCAQNNQVIKKNGYTLNFVNQAEVFDPVVKKQMVAAFFKVYPVLSKIYNPAAAKEVTFIIDTAYKGVASTQAGKVSYSPVWFEKHPADIDVVTHEVMHIVQDYGQGGGPWWITEGIADYVRYKYGVANDRAKWSLPAYKPEQNYDNGYRITARFFAWMESHGYPGIVVNLDRSMRDHRFTDGFWKQTTGKTVSELWAAYAENPAI